jgi:hypothetical protein
MSSNVRGGGVTGWVGWIRFAALVLVMVGAFNIIDGLVALTNHKVYHTSSGDLIVLNFTAWGWILLILGIVQILVGIFLYKGSIWAQLAAVFFIILNSIAQLSFITAYPPLAILVIILNVVVLWAICVHGDEQRRPTDS